MITIATVLRSGGDFLPEHVERLTQQVKAHTPEAQVVTLSDLGDSDSLNPLPLRHNWPGWWSKIELFRPGLFSGPVIYLDLDTSVLGDLTPFVREKFTMLKDFNRPEFLASGVMSWTGDAPSEVYERFKASPERFMDYHRRWPKIGDQGFIHDTLGSAETFDSGISSYKVHCKKQGSMLPDTRILCYHGRPRPWDVEDEHQYAA